MVSGKHFQIVGLVAIAVAAALLLNYQGSGIAAPPTPAATPDPTVISCLQQSSESMAAERQRQREPSPAVYYAKPGETETIFAPHHLTSNNIDVVVSIGEMKLRMTQEPEPAILYLHPDLIDELETAWLRRQYESGIAIVALNTLVSDLGNKLNISAPMEDLKLEYRRGRPFIAVFHKATGYGGTEREVFADFVSDPELIPTIVNKVADSYHLTREYVEPLEGCLGGGQE